MRYKETLFAKNFRVKIFPQKQLHLAANIFLYEILSENISEKHGTYEWRGKG